MGIGPTPLFFTSELPKPPWGAGSSPFHGASQRPANREAHDSAPTSSREILHELDTFNDQNGLSHRAIKQELKQLTRSADILARMAPWLMAQVAEHMKSPLIRRSPRGVLVGDAHLGNFGAMVRSRSGKLLPAAFTIVDITKVGHGPIAYDAVRAAATTLLLGEARAQKLRQSKYDKDAEEVLASAKKAAKALIHEWVDELRRFQETGQRPAGGYVTVEELQALDPKDRSGLQSLLRRAEASNPSTHPDKKQKDFQNTLPKHGKRKRVAAAFQRFVQTVGRQVCGLRALKFRQRLPDGGSNYKLKQTLVLAEVEPEIGEAYKQVFEIKQLIPPPTELKGKPRADPTVTIQEANLLRGFEVPLMGALEMKHHGKVRPYIVLPLGGVEELDVDELHGKGLVVAARATGRTLARAHLQSNSVDPDHLRKWFCWLRTSKASPEDLLYRAAEGQAKESQAMLEKLLREGGGT